MTSRLLGVGLAAVVGASGLTGCMTSRQYNASKKRADERVAHYNAHPELHPPKYAPPAKKTVHRQRFSVDAELLARLNEQEENISNFHAYIEERRNERSVRTHEDLYDPCTGECLLNKPSEGAMVSYVFYRFTKNLDNNHPVRRAHDGAKKVTGDIAGWMKEITGAEKVDTYGLGIMFRFEW